MAVYEIDFTQAPPKQGGGLPNIPEGPYTLVVTEVEESNGGKYHQQLVVTMAVADGPYVTTEFKDYFSPFPALPGKMSGIQKLHLFLNACGKSNLKKVSFDPQKIIGFRCTANIHTETIAPSADYPNPTPVSKIASYEIPNPMAAVADRVAASNGTGAAPVNTAATAPSAPVAVAQPPATTEAPSDGLSVALDDDVFA